MNCPVCDNPAERIDVTPETVKETIGIEPGEFEWPRVGRLLFIRCEACMANPELWYRFKERCERAAQLLLRAPQGPPNLGA